MREELGKAHPLAQLLVLILAGVVFTFIVSILSIIPLSLSGNGLAGVAQMLNGENLDESALNYMKILQILHSIALFVAPYLLYRYFMRQPSYNIGTNSPLTLAFFMVIMLCAFPLVNALAVFNGELHLPEFMASLEHWIYETEAKAEVLIAQFLHMESIADLLFSLVLIALVPAVAEELFFRGAIQPMMQRWLKNPHAAVWVTAFIFSFIHLQFLGFLPRFILGAVLGYAALWSRSLIVPMGGHFLNNGLAVVIAWVVGTETLSADYNVFGTTTETYLYGLASLGLVGGGMWVLNRLTAKTQKTPNGETEGGLLN